MPFDLWSLWSLWSLWRTPYTGPSKKSRGRAQQTKAHRKRKTRR